MKNSGSQLRAHLNYTFQVRIRSFIQRFRLGAIGTGVFIEKGVELLRYPKNIFLGNNIVIKTGAKICSCNSGAIISIGDNTTVGYHTFIFASARIEIGNDCLIAPFVYIVDSNHQIKKDTKINAQPNVTAPIRIGNDVWIASNVTILKGVSIGNGAVIAANSVVNRDVADYEIFGGTPAVKIGERT